ncbi:MAG: transcriptional regulator, partial [Candidatus Aenigmarchaeota archaeon]|nr:transcriptional regulator [Candidatus Aenigmarchaeota archaeon]NIQ17195.1 transcriptional regulator [Candidatus Aenigmarchaeota archaeon]
CENVYFPPRNLCPACRRSGDIQELQLSGKGKILSYTIIRTPPEGFEHYVPYAVAIIRL